VSKDGLDRAEQVQGLVLGAQSVRPGRRWFVRRLVPTWAGPGDTPRCCVDVGVGVCASATEDVVQGKSSREIGVVGGTITDRLGGLKLSDQTRCRSKSMSSEKKRDLVDLLDDPLRSESEMHATRRTAPRPRQSESYRTRRHGAMPLHGVPMNSWVSRLVVPAQPFPMLPSKQRPAQS
jgi:hypothetical protein